MKRLKPMVLLSGVAVSSLTCYMLLSSSENSTAGTQDTHVTSVEKSDTLNVVASTNDKHSKRFESAPLAPPPSPTANSRGGRRSKAPATTPAPLALDDIPDGRLKDQVATLGMDEQQVALDILTSLGKEVVANDFESLNVDNGGGVFYTCNVRHPGSGEEEHTHSKDCNHGHQKSAVDSSSHQTAGTEAVYEDILETTFDPAGSVSVDKVPVFHSRKGASKTIFLDFNGGNVSGTAWNSGQGVDAWDCKAYSIDSNYSTFSAQEQKIIHETWMRIAEDYSSFDVDVTTEDPGTRGKSVAWAMITDVTDKNNKACPHKNWGGIAYVNIFGTGANSTYSPAWVTPSKTSPYMASSISHELGHNMGLGHDGSPSREYYSGHSAGSYRWGPIMGGGATLHISQWSNGNYSGATNSQDDLGIIGNKLGYIADEQGSDIANSQLLLTRSQKNVSKVARIERTNDVDVFKLECSAGNVTVNVDPFSITDSDFSYQGQLGGNLFVTVKLQDASGNTVATSTPDLGKQATITKTLADGTYYLVVKPRSIGNPMANPATGFDTYGTVGTYSVSVKADQNSGSDGDTTGGDTGGSDDNDPVDEPVLAALTTPAPNSELSGDQWKFKWNGAANGNYYLFFGSSKGNDDSGRFGQISAKTEFSVNRDELKLKDNVVWVRLWQSVDGNWTVAGDYHYTYASPELPGMYSPVPESKLTGSKWTFKWRNTSASSYYLFFGTGKGNSQSGRSGIVSGKNEFSIDRSSLDLSGGKLWVRLWKYENNSWDVIDDYKYLYDESSVTNTDGSDSDTNGSGSNSSNVTELTGTKWRLQWNAVSTPFYRMTFGSRKGWNDIGSTGRIYKNSYVLRKRRLNLKGNTLWIRLWRYSYAGGTYGWTPINDREYRFADTATTAAAAVESNYALYDMLGLEGDEKITVNNEVVFENGEGDVKSRWFTTDARVDVEGTDDPYAAVKVEYDGVATIKLDDDAHLYWSADMTLDEESMIAFTLQVGEEERELIYNCSDVIEGGTISFQNIAYGKKNMLMRDLNRDVKIAFDNQELSVDKVISMSVYGNATVDNLKLMDIDVTK